MRWLWAALLLWRSRCAVLCHRAAWLERLRWSIVLVLRVEWLSIEPQTVRIACVVVRTILLLLSFRWLRLLWWLRRCAPARKECVWIELLLLFSCYSVSWRIKNLLKNTQGADFSVLSDLSVLSAFSASAGFVSFGFVGGCFSEMAISRCCCLALAAAA